MIFRISSYHNGLGDSLQFSTFPETLVNLGAEVHLYNGPEVLPFRNSGIKSLIYDQNPFITGESNGLWDFGDIPSKPYSNIHDDFIKNWETIFGLPCKNSLPKIYYNPKPINGIENLIELSSTSLKYNHEYVISEVLNRIGGDYDKWVQIKSKNQPNCIDIPQIKSIFAEDLPQICDMIFSCSNLISLNSGVHSLAAAIQRFNNKFKHTCFLPFKDYDWIMDSKKFVFPNIKYVKV